MAMEQPQKMARLHRHAKRSPGLNNLKPRFSPTAVFNDPGTATSQPTTTAPAVTTTSSSATPAPVTTSKAPVTTANPQTTTTSAVQPTTTSTSSTSTSSSTSSLSSTTSSVPSTTTSATHAIVAATTPVSTAVATTFVTTSFRSVAPAGSSTVSLASASASATAAPSGGVSTTGIIGIAAAAVVGVSIIAGVGMYFLRRCGRRRDDEYNPDDFRRQSVVLPDESPSPLYQGNSGSGSTGRGPRPPTMIERHYLNMSTPQPPSMSYQPPQQYGVHNAYSDYSASPITVGSFAPGEIVSPISPGPGSPPPQGHQYANVPPSFFSPMSQSPIASPASVAPYSSAYDEQGRLMRSPSNGAVALTRGNSVAQSPPQHPGLNAPPMPENDYMDVTRASVTPYQAEQYAAISRQLNIPPVPLPQVNENEEQEAGENVHMPAPVTNENQPLESPFGDPQESTAHYQSSRPSSEFHEHHSYARPGEAVPRVPSFAPVLPDIQLQQRAFSPLSFPVSPSPMRATFGVDANAPPAARADLPPLSPVTSSPRRAQFVQNETRAHDGRETPVEIGFVDSPASTPAPQAAHQQASAPANASAEKKRHDTLYDDDDAYGGF